MGETVEDGARVFYSCCARISDLRRPYCDYHLGLFFQEPENTGRKFERSMRRYL